MEVSFIPAHTSGIRELPKELVDYLVSESVRNGVNNIFKPNNPLEKRAALKTYQRTRAQRLARKRKENLQHSTPVSKAQQQPFILSVFTPSDISKGSECEFKLSPTPDRIRYENRERGSEKGVDSSCKQSTSRRNAKTTNFKTVRTPASKNNTSPVTKSPGAERRSLRKSVSFAKYQPSNSQDKTKENGCSRGINSNVKSAGQHSNSQNKSVVRKLFNDSNSEDSGSEIAEHKQKEGRRRRRLSVSSISSEFSGEKNSNTRVSKPILLRGNLPSELEKLDINKWIDGTKNFSPTSGNNPNEFVDSSTPESSEIFPDNGADNQDFNKSCDFSSLDVSDKRWKRLKVVVSDDSNSEESYSQNPKTKPPIPPPPLFTPKPKKPPHLKNLPPPVSSDNNAGTSRFGRKLNRPLKYWLNERNIYRFDKNMVLQCVGYQKPVLDEAPEIDAYYVKRKTYRRKT